MKKNTPTSVKPANKRQEAKLASRMALIDSAVTLIPKKGLDVSLDELCAHAGYTRGVFYVHFKNRDELTLAVMSRIGEEWLDDFFNHNNKEMDLFTAVALFMQHFLSGQYPIGKKGSIRPQQLLEACERSPKIKKRYLALAQESMNRLSQNIKNSQNKNQLDKNIDANNLALILVALVIGMHTLHDLGFPIDFTKGMLTLGQLLPLPST